MFFFFLSENCLIFNFNEFLLLDFKHPLALRHLLVKHDVYFKRSPTSFICMSVFNSNVECITSIRTYTVLFNDPVDSLFLLSVDKLQCARAVSECSTVNSHVCVGMEVSHCFRGQGFWSQDFSTSHSLSARGPVYSHGQYEQ